MSSKNNVCEHCQFCVADMNQKQLIYKCTRFPPNVSAVTVQGPMGQTGLQMMSMRPQVNQQDTCGEFKDKPPTIKMIN